MSVCQACNDDAAFPAVSATITVAGLSAQLDAGFDPAGTWAVGDYVLVDQTGGASYGSDSDGPPLLSYLYTPISGAFKITAFSPYVPPVSPAVSSPDASLTIALPTGGGFAANAYNGSTLLDGLDSTAQILVGMAVSGPGVPGGTFVADVVDSQSVILTQAVSLENPSSANTEYTFTPNYQGTDFSGSNNGFYNSPLGQLRSCADFEGNSAFTNITSRFSSLKIEYNASADYNTATTGGMTTAVVDPSDVGGGRQTTVTTPSSSGSANGTAAASGSFEACSSQADASILVVPPGQFAVLQCADCCAACFYEIVIVLDPAADGFLGTGAADAMTSSGSLTQTTVVETTTDGGSSTVTTTVEATSTQNRTLTLGTLTYGDTAPYCVDAAPTGSWFVGFGYGTAASSPGSASTTTTVNGTVTTTSGATGVPTSFNFLMSGAGAVPVNACDLSYGGSWTLTTNFATDPALASYNGSVTTPGNSDAYGNSVTASTTTQTLTGSATLTLTLS